MNELENLRRLYLEGIGSINKKGELTPSESEAAIKALEGINLIDCICGNNCEDGYSEGYRRSYSRDYSDGYSNGMTPRYSMDYGWDDRSHSRMPEMHAMRHMPDYDPYSYRYSRDSAAHDMIDRLEEMKHDTMDERKRRVIENAISDLRNLR